MAITVADVEARIQRFVADSLGDWATAANLDPFIFSTYRDVVRLLRAGGVTMFRRTSAPISLAAGITSIARAVGVSPVSPTAYPADLIRPVEIVEKVGSGTYLRMSQSSGVMEDRALTATMQEWDWKYDSIVFPGASGTVSVKIEYEAELPALTSGSSVLLIPDGDDAVTYLAAARALRSRGGQDDLAASLETAAQQAIASIVASESVGRSSSSGRWGPQDQGAYPSVQAVLRMVGPLAARALQGQPGLGDWELMPFVRAAYRSIARALRAAGISVFRRTSDKDTPILVGAGATSVARAAGSVPVNPVPYPADLLRPIEVMERIWFSHPPDPAPRFLRMSQSEGLFEDRVANEYLQEWEWKDDAIRFVGASGDVEIIIEYEAVLPELLSPSDLILIPDAVDTIACLAASYAVTGRPNVTGGDQLAAEARRMVDDLVASELAVKIAMGGRWGPQDQTEFVSVQSILRVCSGFVNQDPARKPLSDAALMPFIRSAYADVIQALRVERSNYFVKKDVVLDVPNTNGSLGPATTPPLPADFIRPLYIREQWAAHDGNGYTPMQPVSLTAVDRQQVYNNYRGYYWWAGGSIYFPQTGNRPEPPNDPYNTDFEIVYEYEPDPLLTPQSKIAIPNGGTAVAVLAAAYVFMARGADPGPLRKEADVLIGRLIDADKISRETAPGQFGPKRPPTS